MDAGERGFRIRLLPRGFEFETVAGESVLDAARRAGYTFPHSCENGVCGICRGKLLTGRVDHGGIGLYGLSPEDQAEGFILCCTARPQTDVTIEVDDVLAPGEFPLKTLACQVTEMTPVSDDTWRVGLRPPVFDRPKFLAGQYLFLIGQDGARRAFSIASAPENNEQVELHIRATPGHTSAEAVIAELKAHPFAKIELPHGRCVLRNDQPERPIILLAGGTGFAPLKAMMESLLARGETRDIHLYRGAHSRNHLYLRELPATWASRHSWFRYTEVLSGEQADWSGRTGLVHEAVLADYPDLSNVDVYASGRPEMVFAAYEAFKRQGLPADRYFSDMLDLRGNA